MDVAIFIPLFNRLELTRACLESLEHTVRGVRYEVILIDDGSTDGTREFLQTLSAPRYRVLLNERPQGYARNNNAAARLTRAPVLCLLNNDTALLSGWLEGMLKVLRNVSLAGLVGNIQREPISGLIDHAGIVFNERGIPVHAGKDTAAPPPESYTRWPAVTAACCVVRRKVFEQMGGFDEAFRNGFEDMDFCLRAAEAGFGHYVANRSIIYHHVSSSPGRHAHEAENLRLYRERWGDRIAAYRRRIAERRSREFTRDSVSAWHVQWETRRETHRQRRQDLIDARRDGRRYLRKHLWRPWRYNLRRAQEALVRAMHPLPDLMPRPPQLYFDGTSSLAKGAALVSDEMLFDPPRQ